jgi:hypothetical protein
MDPMIGLKLAETPMLNKPRTQPSYKLPFGRSFSSTEFIRIPSLQHFNVKDPSDQLNSFDVERGLWQLEGGTTSHDL